MESRLKDTVFNFDFNTVGVYTNKWEDPDHKGAVVDTEEMWGPPPEVGDIVSIATTDDAHPFWVNGTVYKIENKPLRNQPSFVENHFHVMLEDETYYSDEMELTDEEQFRLTAWQAADFWGYVGRHRVSFDSFLKYYATDNPSYLGNLQNLVKLIRTRMAYKGLG